MKRPLNILGIALIVCGIVATVYIVMSYTQDEVNGPLRQSESMEHEMQD